MNFKYILLITLTLLVGDSFADSTSAISSRHRDFLKLYFFHKPEFSAHYDLNSEAEEKDGPSSFDLQSLRLKADLPVSISEDTYLNLGGFYQRGRYEFDDASFAPSYESSVRLHELWLAAGVGHFFSDDLFFKGDVTLGSYSDFSEPFDEDSLRVFSHAELVYRINPGAQLLLGARYSEDFDSTDIFPVFGIRLQDASGRLHLSLTAPIAAKIAYHLNSNSEAYISYGLEGDVYNVELGPQDLNFDIRLQQRKIALGYRQWLNSNFAMNFEVGANYQSEFKYQLDGAGQFEDGKLDTFYFGTIGIEVMI